MPLDPDNERLLTAAQGYLDLGLSLDANEEILVNAVERLPGVAVFAFNLACYEAQLGDVASAKAHLSRAIELRGDLRLRALEDEDLRPLWDSL